MWNIQYDLQTHHVYCLFQESPIIDFYPEDFKIDLNGKKFAWQGVALLPFVEEKRLFKALEPYYEVLTAAESKYELTVACIRI
jgi:5'-3' exonuclease